MDSYEKMRKMGEIASSLEKHGLAESKDEAIKQAEGMTASGNHDFYVSKEKIDEVKKEPEQPVQEEDTAHLKKLQTMVNDQISSVSSEISLMRDKMNEIIAKINELESKVDAKPKSEVQATLATPKQETAQPEPKKDENTVTPEVKKEYTSNDVDVNKIFYSGQK